MHFRRFRYAEMQVCFYSAAPHLHHSEAERVTKLSLERSRLPCGPDFPQTLLTCSRPVFPPDRAPLFLRVQRCCEPQQSSMPLCGARSVGTSTRAGCACTTFGSSLPTGHLTLDACRKPS